MEKVTVELPIDMDKLTEHVAKQLASKMAPITISAGQAAIKSGIDKIVVQNLTPLIENLQVPNPIPGDSNHTQPLEQYITIKMQGMLTQRIHQIIKEQIASMTERMVRDQIETAVRDQVQQIATSYVESLK